jgi:hypothetical protein
MQDLTNTVAHTLALSNVKLLCLSTQERATQVFFLDIAVLHAGPVDSRRCSVPLRLTCAHLISLMHCSCVLA